MKITITPTPGQDPKTPGRAPQYGPKREGGLHFACNAQPRSPRTHGKEP